LANGVEMISDIERFLEDSKNKLGEMQYFNSEQQALEKHFALLNSDQILDVIIHAILRLRSYMVYEPDFFGLHV
jgi:hypothetical protein